MNTSPDKPSTRPMTLRQQLLDIDKLRQTHQIDNPEYIDRLVQVCQEIAREASHLHRYDANMDTCQLCDLTPEQLIENTERLIAELTQKPPQPLADMQSDTSPKADSNQVDNLSPRKEQ